MQAALVTWEHMVLLASKAPTSGSPASVAAKRSLFAGVLTPVLQLLILVPPGAHNQQGAHPSLCSQVLPLDFIAVFCHDAAEAFFERLRRRQSLTPVWFVCCSSQTYQS